MLRKENKLSSRLAVRSTIPDTSSPPKKEIDKLMSFDITGIVKHRCYSWKASYSNLTASWY